MNLLLDTHALLWFLDDDPQLVPTAKSLIEDPANRKHVSVATCWEIAIKAGLRKLDLRRTGDHVSDSGTGDEPVRSLVRPSETGMPSSSSKTGGQGRKPATFLC